MKRIIHISNRNFTPNMARTHAGYNILKGNIVTNRNTRDYNRFAIEFNMFGDVTAYYNHDEFKRFKNEFNHDRIDDSDYLSHSHLYRLSTILTTRPQPPPPINIRKTSDIKKNQGGSTLDLLIRNRNNGTITDDQFKKMVSEL